MGCFRWIEEEHVDHLCTDCEHGDYNGAEPLDREKCKCCWEVNQGEVPEALMFCQWEPRR